MTAASSTPNYARRIIGLMIAVIAAVILWSIGWLWLAEETRERTRAALADAGIGCTDMTPFGYPFRMGIRCSKTGFRFGDGDDAPFVEGLNLRTAAQIYRPSLVIAELDKPALSLADGRHISLDEGVPRASVRLARPMPERVSLVIDAPLVNGLAASLSAAGIEAHMRAGPAGVIDLAAGATGLRAGDGAAIDAAFDAVIADADALRAAIAGGGALPALLRGRSGEIRNLSVTLPDGAGLTVKGPVSVDAEGRVNGELTLAMNEAARLAPALSALAGAFGADAGPLLALLPSGPSAGLVITIRDGVAYAGFIPLGTIPPL